MAAAQPIKFRDVDGASEQLRHRDAGFTGKEIGWLHTVGRFRGFWPWGAILVLLVLREQVLALVALALLGAATAFTAWFPSYMGILVMTLLSSIGFTTSRTANQSLQMQWIEKKDAPRVLGRIVSAGAAASLAAYGAIVAFVEPAGLDYNTVYMAAGGLTLLIVAFAALGLSAVQGNHVQHKHMVLRKRYWLYYALQMMAGARRQIFVVFAGFMMVEKFGMHVSEMTGLLLVNYLINMLVAPSMGRALGKYGERNVMGFGIHRPHAGVPGLWRALLVSAGGSWWGRGASISWTSSSLRCRSA